jgi:hypothetical protein
MKIAPKTTEKRPKRFAPPIDHRGPWYRQRSAIPVPTRLPVTGCSRPENAVFFESAVGRMDEVAANPLSGVAGSTAYI